MKTCPNFRTFLHAEHTGTGAGLLANARCKQWSCSFCAAVNRKQWRKRIFDASEKIESNGWSFATITAHSACRGEEASLANLRAHWSVLRKRLKRQYGKFHFVRVYEKHLDGSYHIHALFSFQFDDLYETKRKRKDGTPVTASKIIDDYVRGRQRNRDRTIKRDENGKEVPASIPKGTNKRLGYIHHAENMRNAGGAAKYITKYMTKGDDKMALNLRRIQCSQGFPKLEKDVAQYEWTAKPDLYEFDASRHWVKGEELYHVGLKRNITSDDFLNGPIFPGDEMDS